MSTSTITSKGQITIRERQSREAMQVRYGRPGWNSWKSSQAGTSSSRRHVR
ncbi:hypothetical protein RLIN73S_05400 [Rhodanobacter lindaniclasticus]